VTGAPPLSEAIGTRIRSLGVSRGAHVLVAVSGGADSVALLHLLRFCSDCVLSAAHFDHAMRPGSAADAAWVRGLCRAWGVPLIEARADRALRSEGDAREARYAFLRAAQRECGAAFLATAHHADDQAETVLLRMLRGTGLGGLAGIPERGPEGLIRPLLPFWRAELRRYAAGNRLRWRRDPTNRGLRPLRNRIRLGLLPRMPEGTRDALVRLAALAGEAEALMERRAEAALLRVSREDDGAVLLEREALGAYDSAIATRVLRRVLRRYGTVLDRPGTRTALQFISTAPSGRELVLPGGRARILTEFGRARIAALDPPGGPDRTLAVHGAEGAGEARIGGATWEVRWRTAAASEAGADETALDPAGAPFRVRGWLPGDRVRMTAGGRTLKKLFNEARVPRSRRARLPVVCDAAGRVVWVVGVARAADPPPPRGLALILSMVDA
jgi:tRNA(Ile)-lysidine synthase